MVSNLLKAPGWVSPGARIYAVGDVHGCATRLADLHAQIAADLHQSPVDRPLLIHLGDYVDRGPDSAAVVRGLAAGPAIPGIPQVNLRGNHEQMMLDALGGDPGKIGHWLANGAGPTLESWGTSAERPLSEWRQALNPAEHHLLSGLPHYHQVDGYVFVHAGLRPGRRLDLQSDEDMLWIREVFLHSHGTILPEAPDMAVVHGHTPKPQPVITGQRIGIDTGAVMGGPLTCAVLEGRTVRFLTVFASFPNGRESG
jgi:serine/threonine protein phosphatase 1